MKIQFSGILDSTAHIVEFNDDFKITGYTDTEVIGKNWFEVFIHDNDNLEVSEVFLSFFLGATPHWEYDNCIICKDGTKKLFHFNNEITMNAKGKPEYISFTAEDPGYFFTKADDI